MAAAAMVVACQQKGAQNTNTKDVSNVCADSVPVTNGDTLTYEGEGPAADGTYKYTLSMYGDSIKEFSYEQIAETPKGTQTTARTAGIAHLLEHNGKHYVRVQQNREDSVTFLQLNDSTLRLVSEKFEEAGEGTNTDLKLKK